MLNGKLIIIRLVFDGNGYSSGDTASVACTYDQNCVLPKNGFSKTGYTFKGWANSRTGNVIFLIMELLLRM
ncbi:MAG: InlB B-repeat-containing protein [Clostridium sp.]|nr:MAG: InlB B-repeat-containing protein [Clostridium sp.]